MNSKYRDHATGLPTTTRVSCQVVTAGGALKTKEEVIICEKSLEVSVNGIPVFRLTCTPQHLTELVLGRLCTERIIRSADEVQQLFICGEGNIAEVTLSENVTFRPYSGAEPTCCTGNRQLAERVDPVKPEPKPTVNVSPEAVFLLTEKFREDGALHRSTGGTHSCYIRFGDGRILSFEDIGRHNALDKAVGAMLLEGADPSGCMLYTTGRIAADMVTKLTGSGIPVLVSKAVPTEEALRLAKENNIALICRAWPDSYTRFN